jgi:hypothetical protein
MNWKWVQLKAQSSFTRWKNNHGTLKIKVAALGIKDVSG